MEGRLDFGLVGHNLHDLHSKGMKNAKLFHEDLLSREREEVGASWSLFILDKTEFKVLGKDRAFL